MTNYLDKILNRKRKEVDRLINFLDKSPDHPINQLHRQGRSQSGNFAIALRQRQLAIIAEVKRASPSKGILQANLDSANQALKYIRGGAAAISILTDSAFDGFLSDLTIASTHIKDKHPSIPFLRKDFIIHPIQLAESVHIGADAVLLIARVLKNKLKEFIEESNKLGIENLVEVENEEEIELAIRSGAKVVGINNRDLASFQVKFEKSFSLKKNIPENILAVSESGIYTPDQAKKIREAGFDAILVGEAFVKSNQPEKLVYAMRGCGYES